jgi:hypothetical protein
VNNKFYIYRYIRLDTNTPFYVGKGKLNRYSVIHNRNKYFKNIYNSVPTEVEIFIENLNEKEALNKEIEFITMYKSMGYCEANLTNGGEGTSGAKISNAHKASIIESNKKRKLTKETKAKISKALKGRKIPKELLPKWSNAQKGRKHTKEFGEKISKRQLGKNNPMYGKKHTKAFKKMMSKINKGSKNPNYKGKS